jgi:hypothetical protein
MMTLTLIAECLQHKVTGCQIACVISQNQICRCKGSLVGYFISEILIAKITLELELCPLTFVPLHLNLLQGNREGSTSQRNWETASVRKLLTIMRDEWGSEGVEEIGSTFVAKLRPNSSLLIP